VPQDGTKQVSDEYESKEKLVVGGKKIQWVKDAIAMCNGNDK